MDIKKYIESGIIEMYVLGLSSPEEEAEFEKLRGQNPELNNAVIRYEEEMEKNMQQHTTLPGDERDKKILNKLDSLSSTDFTVTSYSKGRHWLKMAAAAAVILFAVSGVFNFILYKKTKKQETEINAAKNSAPTLPPSDFSILKNPAITPVAMYGAGTHAICRCTIFWDKRTGKLYIMIHHLPLSSSEKDYQLWAMVDNKPVNVGIINDEIRDRFIEMPNVPSGAIAFIVTLEKSGGTFSPTYEETYLKGNI